MKKNKLVKNLKRNQKGFSLVETLIAIMIFVITITILSGSFSNFASNYANSKKLQTNIEDAQYVMNLFTKTIRTSKVVGYWYNGAFNDFCADNQPDKCIINMGSDDGWDAIRVYDYSQNKCYRFEVKKSEGVIKGDSVDVASENDCLSANYVNDAFSAKILDGELYVDPDVFTDGHKGKVSLMLKVGQDDKNSVTMQSTVSLRSGQEVAVVTETTTPTACTYTYTWPTTCTAGSQTQTWTAAPTGCTGTPAPQTRTCDLTAPTVPANLVATATGSFDIKLTWTASTDAVGVTGYEIFRGTETTPFATSTVTNYTVTGLNALTNYSFKIKAYDAAGNKSGFSNVASTTTLNSCRTSTAPIYSAMGSGCTGNGLDVALPHGAWYQRTYPSGSGNAVDALQCNNGLWNGDSYSDGSTQSVNYVQWQDDYDNRSYKRILCN